MLFDIHCTSVCNVYFSDTSVPPGEHKGGWGGGGRSSGAQAKVDLWGSGAREGFVRRLSVLSLNSLTSI